MAIDTATESAAVLNFGMFPWVALPFVEEPLGPEESAALLKAYGEAPLPSGGIRRNRPPVYSLCMLINKELNR